jgi:hypothetical protein
MDRRGRGSKPAPWLEELDPVAIGKGNGMSGGGGGLPVASARSRSDRDIGGAIGSTVNLVLCALALHLFI